jgi:hypothetical protein
VFVTPTLGVATATSLTSGTLIANGSISGSASAGAISYGTLTYSDVNIVASFASNVNNYNQMILQNTNSGNTASTSFLVSNNNGTATTNYAEFGINSSAFSGTSVFNQPGFSFLASASTDFVIGTYSANAIHFVVNSGTTDAMTISNSGIVSLGTALAVGSGGTGLSSTPANGAIDIGNGTGFTRTTITAGTGISVTNGSGSITIASTATGATITPTTTSGTYYIVGTTSTSGSLSTASISNTNAVSYNASTGALTAVSVSGSSDERLKTDWEDLPVNFIELLSQVKHGVFTRISSGNKEVGVSAQSMRKAISQAVIENDEGMLAVNYGAAALVAAIELANEIINLKAEIEVLKNK